MDTRRAFLKKASLLAGAASLANVIPLSIQKALALDAPAGSTYLDAEHIVILMQENRSFDHAFGMLRGVRGFNDPRAIDQPNKNKVWLQSNSQGQTYAPFHLDINATKATWMSSLPHGWSSQVSARNKGWHDKWLDHKKSINPLYSHMPLTLGYHDRSDIPFYYALADAFTICDQNFCSSLTGTNPNRLFFWSGTIRGGKDEEAKPCLVNGDMDYGTLNWTTFPERLEQQGISWKCYQNEVSIDTGLNAEEDAWLANFQDNPLEFFEQYHIHLHQAHITQLQQRMASLTDLIADLQKKLTAFDLDTPATSLLNTQITHLQNELAQLEVQCDTIIKKKEQLTAYEKSLHAKAFTTNSGDPDHRELQELTYDDNGKQHSIKAPKGDILHQFRTDVKNGGLPMVSWLTAPENFSDHPGAPWFGAWYVSEVLDILTQDPETWKKTIFILAYDENDGYFDHVPPFTPPHPQNAGTGKVSAGIDTRAEFVAHGPDGQEEPIGLGFRVPLMIVSPWSKGGKVNSQVFDHTSTLRFLEDFIAKKTGVVIKEDNISTWRRTVCGDLTSVFTPCYNNDMPVPQFPARDVFLEHIHRSKFKKAPDNYRLLSQFEIDQVNQDPLTSACVPDQEAGVRPSCALPYQFYVNGGLNAADQTFEIGFDNRDELFGAQTAGAPFIVYAPGHNGHNRNYGVKPGDTLKDSWELADFEHGNYHLKVHGPNGFYREFTGNAADADISVNLEHERDNRGTGFTGNVELLLVNRSEHSAVAYIADNAYQTNFQQVTLPPVSRARLVIDLKSSFNWYDISITYAGYDRQLSRYAGRVETGKPGYTDPYMGRTVATPVRIV